MELRRRALAGLVATALVAAACTATRAGHGRPRRLGVAGALAADWEVGRDGGVLSTPDGSVTVNLPKGAAQPGTKVHLQRDQAPRTARLPGFLPLASFDINADTGRLGTGEVTVRYDGQLLQRLHSDPELLVMLISDDKHGWLVLPTAIDRAAGRASARWPHFSSGILGSLRSPGMWLVDHVLTHPLGPKKPADCTKKREGWRTDAGWRFESTNWNGGRMLVPPLDGCAAAAPASGGQHRVEVTNRYWYAFHLLLPAGTDVSNGDVFSHTDLIDAITAVIIKLQAGDALVPGHSHAHLHVQGNPQGQQLQFKAYIDPISFIVTLVMSAIDLASLGEAREVRASLEAAESALWEARAVTGDTVADIAAKTADGSAWREAELKKAGANERHPLEAALDAYSAANCAYGVARKILPNADESLTAETLHQAWDNLGEFTKTVFGECRKQIALAAFREAFKYATPEGQAELLTRIAKAALDPKQLQATIEGSVAGLIRYAGKDYLRAALTATQARDPRLNPFASTDWAQVVRSYLRCEPASGEPWDRISPDVSYADVTGDGARDALVAAGCPSPTSSNPINVVVFDGQSQPAKPREIGVLAARDYYRTLKLSISKTGITLAGQALSDRAPLCCPDLFLTLTYRWDGTTFQEKDRGQRRL